MIRRFIIVSLFLFGSNGLCSISLTQTVSAAEPIKFEGRTIDPLVGQVCYAVALADVDGDQKTDIVAVTENRVVWYQNPDWKPRIILVDQTDRDHVCIAPLDIDGDGKVDFALGAGWLNNKNLGTIQWLSRGKTLDEPWQVHDISRESWTHRMRFGDFLGTGRPQLVVSPLNKTVSPGVRLLAFEIPAKPFEDTWKPTVLDESLNGMHNHWMGDLNGDGRIDILTASMEGVFLLEREKDGSITKTKIGAGAEGPLEPQKSGAGEVKVGHFRNGQPYIATVEPMHGKQAVVYTKPTEKTGLWVRHVLDTTLIRGHALGVADLDHDGSEELILGHSDKGSGDPAGPGVFVYKPDETGEKWEKLVVDNGDIATEDLMVGDLDGDGWADIVAGGRATHNVKVYRNLTGQSGK